MAQSLLAAALGLSIIANLYLAYRAHSRPKSAKTHSYDAKALLRDLLTNEEALVRITRVAPEDIFLRSPRDMG